MAKCPPLVAVFRVTGVITQIPQLTSDTETIDCFQCVAGPVFFRFKAVRVPHFNNKRLTEILQKHSRKQRKRKGSFTSIRLMTSYHRAPHSLEKYIQKHHQ